MKSVLLLRAASRTTPEFQTGCWSGTLPLNVMSPETATSAPHLLTENDLYLFNEGSHCRTYDKMGAHLFNHEGQAGSIKGDVKKKHFSPCLGVVVF